MEQALRESEALLQGYLENAPDGIFVSDLKGAFLYGNSRSEEIIGYRREELLGRSYLERKLLTDSSRKKVIRLLKTCNRRMSAGPNLYEIELVHKGGHTVPVEVSVSLIRYKEQEALLGFVRDITERKKTEAALRESERKFRSIFESFEDIYYQTDMNGIITMVSPSVYRLSGWKPEDVIGQPATIVYAYPEQRAKLLEAVEKQGYVRDYELVLCMRNGTKAMASLSAQLIYDADGAPTGLAGSLRDMTARKRLEQAVKESEEKYRALLDNIPDIAYSLDSTGNVLTVNEAMAARYGYEAKDILGKPFLHVIHPDDRSKIFDSFMQAITDQREYTRGLEFRFLSKDGTVHWGELNSHMRFDAEGGYFREEGIIRDITARRLSEQEQDRLQRRLLQAQKMESIGTLAGGIAHDFNNLLTGIQGFASLMLLETDPSHPQYERLKGIEEQVESGAALTRQLLGFARGGRVEVRPTDINEVIRKISSMFVRTRKEITLHPKYCRGLWMVDADAGQMEQVFMNLCVNAWQAMPGRGEIYIKTENFLLYETEAFPYAVKPGNYIKITVADTGSGMDEKTRARIFDPFFTTKKMGRGTGLGLAMVYGIIKGHGGMINVDSEPGLGTTFTIYLPASEKAMIKEITSIGTVLRGNETILLVDDEKLVLETSRGLLESLGYRVYAVGSGQEAIAVYMEKRNQIDMVILDMVMPGISGGETYEHLKKINPRIRVLLSSGYSMDGQAREILNRGCDGFLQKPFRLEAFSQKVREVLDSKVT